MSKQNTFQLVSDFLNDEKFISWRLFRTEEMDAYWSDFLSKNPELEALTGEAIRKFDENVKLNDADISSDAQEELYQKIETRIRTHKRNNVRFMLSLSSAAAVLLLIVGSVAFFVIKQKNEILTTQNKIVGQTLSDESVQLIVGDEVVALQSHASIIFSDKGKVSITDSTSRTEELTPDENKQNRLIVPFGKRSFITLADGTKVWINSGTEIEFPTKFTGKTRDIKVKGEVYIEVAKSERPFLIRTKHSTVQVLGTKFNVAAYEDERNESVVLVEGSVQVNVGNKTVVTLNPDEKATISAEKVETETVDVSEYTSWKNGILVFDNAPMSEILHKVGRYYNIKFESKSDVKLNEKRCSGKLFLSTNLDSVMASVSVLTSTTYTRNNQIINISKKTIMPMKNNIE